jgi:hypothetical protein
MKFGIHIMAPEPISTAYIIKPSHQPVCMCTLLSLLGKGSVKCILPFAARQRLGKHVPASKKTRNNRRIVGRVCLIVWLCMPLSLLGNSSIKAFPWQRRIVGDVVLYAFCGVSKKSMRLVQPRTYKRQTHLLVRENVT